MTKYYIIDEQTGELTELDAAAYFAWANNNSATTAQGNPVVGGVDKTSVSTGSSSVVGSGVLNQPGSGTASTLYAQSPKPPSGLTREEIQQNLEERRNIQAIALAESIWASFRTVNGLRGYQQLDGGGGWTGGGYPEPEVSDPQETVINREDISGAGIDDFPAGISDDPQATNYNDTERIPTKAVRESAQPPSRGALPTLVGVNIDLEDQFPTFSTDGSGGGGGFSPEGVNPYPIDINDIAPGGPGIDDAPAVDIDFDTGLSGRELDRLVDSAFRRISDFTPTNPEQAQAQIANIQTLLETDGFGVGLTADDRQFLQDRLQKDQALVNFRNQTIDVATQIIAEARDLSGAITDTGTGAARQLITDYLDSLSPQELAILQSDPAVYRNLFDASGLDFLASAGTTVTVPFTPRDVDLDPVARELADALVAEWISQNGSITESQYNAIVDATIEQTRVQQQENLPVFEISSAEAERDPNNPNNAFIFRTSTNTTTVPAADTNTVLIGNDTAPPSTDPGGRRVDAVAPAAVGAVYVSRYDSATGRYDVINTTTGQVVADDLTRKQADRQAKAANEGDAPAAAAVPPPPPPPPERKSAAAPVGGNFTESFNPETGTYDVVNIDNGAVVATGLTEQQATLEAQNASVGDPSYGSGLIPTTPVAISNTATAPVNPGGRFTESFNAETGSYDVINVDTGAVVATGLTEQQAVITAQDASIGDPSYGSFVAAGLTEEEIQALDNPPDVDPLAIGTTVEGAGIDDERPAGLDPQPDPYGVDGEGIGLTEEEIQAQDNPVSPDVDPYEVDNNDRELTEEEIQAQDNPPSQTAEQQATLAKAQAQATLANQQKQANQGDWRVKLRLAPGANYLYRASDGKGSQAGILQPLAVTDGVVFPYTPVISTAYRANYSNYDLTHSNYRGYFYQGSTVEEVTIQATFTAQDTYEANYLLAVIHFFKAVTKMFYGQDAERGAPPPLVYLQGFGEFQFNLHPCVVSSFNYNLPNDVDYIRARSPNINGTDLLQARQRQTVSTNPFAAAWERLQNAGLPKGGINTPPPVPTLGTNSPTYVPTKMDMTITLLPMQSREQQSQQFSLKQYANGDLLKGGFW